MIKVTWTNDDDRIRYVRKSNRYELYNGDAEYQWEEFIVDVGDSILIRTGTCEKEDLSPELVECLDKTINWIRWKY